MVGILWRWATDDRRLRWQQAIRDLVDHGLVVDRNGKDNVFEVTHKGYETATQFRLHIN